MERKKLTKRQSQIYDFICSEVAEKGPKGTLNQTFTSKMNIAVEGNEILVTRPDDEKESRSLHGLTRTLIP